MYATGIVRSPKHLIDRMNLEKHDHYVVCFATITRNSPGHPSNRTTATEGDVCRYHLWVFDAPPLVLPALEEDLIVLNGPSNIKIRLSGFEKGVPTGWLERITDNLRARIQASY
ncbi:hypothetical protein CORC01_01228 [Colletotrichum orchidophilum]|uniref:Uncharacterized protein n=1 Tax=Colletotrichum orchidophilum TaxID=1209926 RepID=A0A1G4BPZ8_9PEZI|nr:uncharacterized protein CORC01_01228 [Colletotrichum orchidophilum]OHF03509.1 hypothetical protein CORC01_01228 [Colletotrichum orchidophilum]